MSEDYGIKNDRRQMKNMFQRSRFEPELFRSDSLSNGCTKIYNIQDTMILILCRCY